MLSHLCPHCNIKLKEYKYSGETHFNCSNEYPYDRYKVLEEQGINFSLAYDSYLISNLKKDMGQGFRTVSNIYKIWYHIVDEVIIFTTQKQIKENTCYIRTKSVIMPHDISDFNFSSIKALKNRIQTIAVFE